MIKRIALAFVTLALPFSFAACGADSGNVYDKQYHEAYYSPYQVDDYAYTCQFDYDPFYGNGGGYHNVCKNRQVGSHTEQHYHQACWELKFKNSDGDKGDDCVGEETYNSIALGDYYSK